MRQSTSMETPGIDTARREARPSNLRETIMQSAGANTAGQQIARACIGTVCIGPMSAISEGSEAPAQSAAAASSIEGQSALL
ncbi:hypothetical protein [Croceicoccus sp. YJ47]|uniref:hypothetical protein n=1 Tax=Croceicoccus sp. YJ47 TaxID=2798724 RepID=UPI001922CF34|nr:hypothetical protein [Croceicoccus sp. YJ47]QQN75237.1 hypothetical protein JD971_06115 [Croceicoccus sp. YJ47]